MAMPAPPLLLFSGCRVALVQSHGLPRTQVKALERLLSRQGARLSEVGSATHVICAAPSDEQLLHVPAGARCVSPAWLIESRKAGERLSEEEFEHVVSAGGASARHGCSAASSSCPIGALALPQQQAKRPPSRRARTAETLADTTGDAALGAEERGSAEEIKQPPAKRACTAFSGACCTARCTAARPLRWRRQRMAVPLGVWAVRAASARAAGRSAAPHGGWSGSGRRDGRP